MSRIIKFRAWRKSTGWADEVTVYGDGSWSAKFGDIEGYDADDGVVLMEWTGFRDTQGKEIWEGDIVRINHPADLTGDFTNAVGDVFWWDEEGGWYHGNNHGRPPKRMWEYVEVIGNIYEHPELLEEVK